MESEIIFGKKLGRGSFGRVYAATWRGKSVAVKCSLPGRIDTFQFLRDEEYILQDLAQNEHIVSVLGSEFTYTDNNEPIYQVVMERVEGGSLSRHIRRKGGQLAEDDVRLIARMVAEGIAFIHSKNYVHCDIKPGNLLVTKEDVHSRVRVKIADFGLAKEAGTEVGSRGTEVYKSPEALRGVCEKPMDVWGLGCVVLEMLVGKFWRSYVCLLSSKLSPSAKEFLGHCFAIDPKKRWTAEQLLRHPFLDTKGLNFGSVPAAGGKVEEMGRGKTGAEVITITSDDDDCKKIKQTKKREIIIISDDEEELGSETTKKRKINPQ